MVFNRFLNSTDDSHVIQTSPDLRKMVGPWSGVPGNASQSAFGSCGSTMASHMIDGNGQPADAGFVLDSGQATTKRLKKHPSIAETSRNSMPIQSCCRIQSPESRGCSERLLRFASLHEPNELNVTHRKPKRQRRLVVCAVYVFASGNPKRPKNHQGAKLLEFFSSDLDVSPHDV